MINLITTSDVVRVITSHAADIDVLASYVDTDLSTSTPGVQKTAITSAATTTVISAPAASTYRNVKMLQICNKDSTDSALVTIQFYNGTAYVLREQLLPPGVTLMLDDVGNWTVLGDVPRVKQQQFTSGAGTYTTPAGAKSIFVELIGGGGGGGGCADAATNGAGAGGGGAGEYACKLITNPSATYAYSVGAAGTGGSSGNNPGNPGGTTSFGGGLFTAAGGSGGIGDSVAAIHAGGLGGLGGTGGTAGDLNVPGQAGEAGMSIAAAQSRGGAGAPSKYGPGGDVLRNVSSAGSDALIAGSGAGGGGACVISSGGSFAGGSGATGRVVVTEYY